MDVFEAINERSSKRAFQDTPAPRELIMDILTAAGRAPSAINLQPWEFTIVSGEERSRLSRVLQIAFQERNIGCGTGSSKPLPDRLKERQYSSFLGLADLLQAESEEVSQFINKGSLDFYGAPHAVIITKEKVFPAQYLTSAGIMIGYLVLAAQAKGLATCPVGLINAYEEAVLDFINIEDRDLILGLALGYAEPDARVNRLRTPREHVDRLVRWYG